MALITRPSEHPTSQDLPQEHSTVLSTSDCCVPDPGDPVEMGATQQTATTPRFFREDPATESPQIKSRLLRSAVKDICDDGGTLEAIESACSRVLSRDARIGVKYTLTNDLVAWMLHRLSGMAELTANHPALIALAQLRDRLLAVSTSTTIVRPGSPTLLEGRTGVDLSQLGPWTAEAALVYLTSLIVQQRAATTLVWSLPESSGPHLSRVPTLQDRIATILNATGRPLSPTTDTAPMSESCDDNIVLNIDAGFHAGWAECSKTEFRGVARSRHALVTRAAVSGLERFARSNGLTK
eukprot:m.455664 g.455664  ORF g.455664 m.455664 type:complete len:296 (-) comp20916_c0_seq1:191-1078(-)